jgi:hypothetical protein
VGRQDGGLGVNGKKEGVDAFSYDFLLSFKLI